MQKSPQKLFYCALILENNLFLSFERSYCYQQSTLNNLMMTQDFTGLWNSQSQPFALSYTTETLNDTFEISATMLWDPSQQENFRGFVSF